MRHAGVVSAVVRGTHRTGDARACLPGVRESVGSGWRRRTRSEAGCPQKRRHRPARRGGDRMASRVPRLSQIRSKRWLPRARARATLISVHAARSTAMAATPAPTAAPVRGAMGKAASTEGGSQAAAAARAALQAAARARAATMVARAAPATNGRTAVGQRVCRAVAATRLTSRSATNAAVIGYLPTRARLPVDGTARGAAKTKAGRVASALGRLVGHAAPPQPRLRRRRPRGQQSGAATARGATAARRVTGTASALLPAPTATRLRVRHATPATGRPTLANAT